MFTTEKLVEQQPPEQKPIITPQEPKKPPPTMWVDFLVCRYIQAFSQGPKRGRPILVQRYIYSKEGGLRKHSFGKPLKFTLLHISICSKLVRNFLNTLGFVSLCRYASLLNYDIFIQPGTLSNWSKCQMYNNNENWSYFVSDILIYLGKNFK
jgi:hypothetical protein